MSNNIIDTVKVRYNFEGDDSSELTIKKNDIIDVIVKDPSGWADGILRSTNKRGNNLYIYIYIYIFFFFFLK